MSDKDIAREIRERELRRLTEVFAACECTYPLVRFRNTYGHAGNCPACAVIDQHRAEDERARKMAR